MAWPHEPVIPSSLPVLPRFAAVDGCADAGATCTSGARCSAPGCGPSAAPSAPGSSTEVPPPATARSAPHRARTDLAGSASLFVVSLAGAWAGLSARASADPLETPPATGSRLFCPLLPLLVPDQLPAHRWQAAPADPGSGGSPPATPAGRCRAAAPAAEPPLSALTCPRPVHCS